MLESIRKVVGLLDATERKQAAGVLVMITGMAILETLGVVSVMPFLAVLGDPGLIERNALLAEAYQLSSAAGHRQFLVWLGSGCFLFTVVSAGFRTFTHFRMNRFVEMLRHSLSVRLMSGYLAQPYEFFIARHSSDLSKTILSEVDQVVQRVLRPAMGMAAYTVVLAALLAMLVWTEPLLALLTFSLMGGLYLLIYSVMRRRMRRLGRHALDSNRLRFEAASESLSGIKEIKLLGRAGA